MPQAGRRYSGAALPVAAEVDWSATLAEREAEASDARLACRAQVLPDGSSAAGGCSARQALAGAFRAKSAYEAVRRLLAAKAGAARTESVPVAEQSARPVAALSSPSDVPEAAEPASEARVAMALPEQWSLPEEEPQALSAEPVSCSLWQLPGAEAVVESPAGWACDSPMQAADAEAKQVAQARRAELPQQASARRLAWALPPPERRAGPPSWPQGRALPARLRQAQE